MKHQASGMRARTEKRFDLRIEKHTVGVVKRARRRDPDGAAGAHSDLAAVLPSLLLLPEWLDTAADPHCLADGPRTGAGPSSPRSTPGSRRSPLAGQAAINVSPGQALISTGALMPERQRASHPSGGTPRQDGEHEGPGPPGGRRTH